jgi:hypothetical protein
MVFNFLIAVLLYCSLLEHLGCFLFVLECNTGQFHNPKHVAFLPILHTLLVC